MKLKKVLVNFVLVLGLILSTLYGAISTTAYAGQDEWTYSACRPDVQWYNQTGLYGTYYYWNNNPPNVYFVGGRRMNAYSNWNYQCGTLGPPTSELYQNYIQWFQNGYIMWDPGGPYDYSGCWRVYYGPNRTKDWACY